MSQATDSVRELASALCANFLEVLDDSPPLSQDEPGEELPPTRPNQSVTNDASARLIERSPQGESLSPDAASVLKRSVDRFALPQAMLESPISTSGSSTSASVSPTPEPKAAVRPTPSRASLWALRMSSAHAQNRLLQENGSVQPSVVLRACDESSSEVTEQRIEETPQATTEPSYSTHEKRCP